MRRVKLLFFVCALFTGTLAVGQPYPIRVGFNLNQFDVNSARTGAGLSIKVSRLYFDIASNFARGEGKVKKSKSEETYKLDKMRIGIINFGYVFNSEKLFIIPKVGVAWSFNILQNDTPSKSFFLWDERDHLNLGLVGGYNLTDKVGIQLGFGTFEKFSAGIHYYIGDY